jgi:pyrophosphatase PpaX
MTHPIRAVLFDLDGTLLDSIRLIIDSYHHALAQHGIPARSDEHWLAGIGTPLWVQFADFGEDPALLAALVDSYRDYNLGNHDARVRAYPGAVALVGDLRRRGFRTGLVTSKQRAGAERGLRFLGLADAMDVIVGADDVTNPKPHPEPLLRAAETLGIDPRAAIYVGDSEHDMKSGRAAGMRTAAALWGPFSREHLGHTEPDHWLDLPGDLLSVLEPPSPAETPDAGRSATA